MIVEFKIVLPQSFWIVKTSRKTKFNLSFYSPIGSGKAVYGLTSNDIEKLAVSIEDVEIRDIRNGELIVVGEDIAPLDTIIRWAFKVLLPIRVVDGGVEVKAELLDSVKSRFIAELSKSKHQVVINKVLKTGRFSLPYKL